MERDPVHLQIPSFNQVLPSVKKAYTENFKSVGAELLELSCTHRQTISKYCSNFIVYS